MEKAIGRRALLWCDVEVFVVLFHSVFLSCVFFQCVGIAPQLIQFFAGGANLFLIIIAAFFQLLQLMLALKVCYQVAIVEKADPYDKPNGGEHVLIAQPGGNMLGNFQVASVTVRKRAGTALVAAPAGYIIYQI